MSNHLQEIIEKATAYQQSLEKSKAAIEENRRVWNAETNKLIKSVFNAVVQQSPQLNWDPRYIEALENLDLLTLGFKSESSGIVGQIRGVFKFFAKESGRLAYAQVYNGEIYVSITYPHVENHVEQQAPKFLGKFCPCDITTDIVLNHIDDFLEEMLNWESGTRKIIGFFNS